MKQLIFKKTKRQCKIEEKIIIKITEKNYEKDQEISIENHLKKKTI